MDQSSSLPSEPDVRGSSPSEAHAGQTTGPGPQERRGGLVMACLSAGFLLTLVEVVRWLGQRNYLPSGYYALCIGLALVASFAIGWVCKLMGFSRPVGLGIWTALVAGVVADPISGLIFGVVTELVLSLPSRPKPVPAIFEGAAVGAALILVLLKCGGLVGFITDHVPGISSAVLLPVVGSLILIACLGLIPLFVVRFHGPLRARAFAAVPVLICLWFAIEPFTHRGSGTHRSPRANFAASRPLPNGDAETAPRPDIVLIVLDTLRADHLSVYGYERETTPNLKRLMAERSNAVAFPSAYSNGTWTVPSHASLFTGLMPNKHGAHFDLDGSLRIQFGMHEGTPRLATQLKGEGYAVLGVFANHWLKIVDGMKDDFDSFFQVIKFSPLPFFGEHLRTLLVPGAFVEVTKGGPRGTMVNRALLDIQENWDQAIEHPLFLFANYGDTHSPYAPPKPFRGTFHPSSLREHAEHPKMSLSSAELDVLIARYDEELLYLDDQLGLLLDRMEASGFLDGAWVFITSDHGEAFGEHGSTEHGTSVYQEVVHVPLIVFPPAGVELTAVNAPVSLVDVSATIAAIAGTTLENSPGRDLRSLDQESAQAGIEFYGDAGKAKLHGAVAAIPQRSVLRAGWKLTVRGNDVNGDPLEVLLFSLSADPGEKVNVAEENPDVVAELLEDLSPFGKPVVSNQRVTDESRQFLGELGYVGETDSDDEVTEEAVTENEATEGETPEKKQESPQSDG